MPASTVPTLLEHWCAGPHTSINVQHDPPRHLACFDKLVCLPCFCKGQYAVHFGLDTCSGATNTSTELEQNSRGTENNHPHGDAITSHTSQALTQMLTF